MSKVEVMRKAPKQNNFVDVEPFWRGTAEGKLVLQYCPEGKQFQHYPRPLSLYTGKRNLEWREVSGEGVIYAHSALRSGGLGAGGGAPLLIATIELDEGVRIVANLLNTQPENVKIGARVRLVWDELSDGVRYPAFELMA
jgi:uncharacterized OB-fold protein